jgi:signal transduction histidine kinase
VDAIDWDFFIAWLFAPGFSLLIILYLQRRGWRLRTRLDPLYLAYLILGMLWGVGVLLAHPRIRDLPLFVPLERLAPYFLAAGPSLLLLVTANLVRGGRRQWRWLLIVPALLIVAALFHDGALRSDLSRTLALGVRRFDRDGLWRMILLIANLISAITALRLSVELYRRGWGLVYRNRLRYWFLALALATLGDWMAFIFPHPELGFYLGGLVRLGGVTMMTAILLVPYLPSTNDLLRLFLNLLTMGLATFGLLLSGTFAAQAILPGNEQGAALVGAASVSAIVALIYLPLQKRVQSAIDGLVLGRQADLNNVRVEYIHQIGQQLDLRQLAGTIMSLLSGALHLESEKDDGALLLAKTTDQGVVKLTPIPRPGRPALPNLQCSPDSPLAAYWRENTATLSRFDIEMLPDFATLPDDERERLDQWGATLYLPLHTSKRLVGMLALGPKRAGGTYSAAELRFLRDLTGQTAAALEQARLLSDLKVANEQLTHLSDELAQVNRRLYEADQLKSGFIGVITHELRSPFVALALSLQLIERYGLEHLLPEQQEQLEILQKGITELKQMVDHIIAFASLLSKQGELRMERLDLGAIINETVTAIKPMAQSRQVQLDARVWPSLPPILGDRERLSDAVYQLIHNAIKFNQSGGWVRVRCQPDNGNIEIQVQDNGIGVPTERLEHLWQAFAQMSDPLRRGVEGLGLGLALVRYVAVAHGGEIWATSVEGEGSTFGFKVPTLRPGNRHEAPAPRHIASPPAQQ